MGKILSIIFGIIFIILGITLLLRWWFEFVLMLRGALPLLFILGGFIALLAGLAELKDTLKLKKK